MSFFINIIQRVIIVLINFLSEKGDVKKTLTYLLQLDNYLYEKISLLAVKYGNGIHPKHKHLHYHDFFIDHINKGSKVLDIGCGNGTLTHDVAQRVKNVKVTGIDISKRNIEEARSINARSNIEYVIGDINKFLLKKHYDVIIMSNVLEHIKERKQILRKVVKSKPKYLLIRVPLYERDWRVPLKEEMGIDYRLDKTHFIEYKVDEFENELSSVGLKIVSKTVQWGELWVISKPKIT